MIATNNHNTSRYIRRGLLLSLFLFIVLCRYIKLLADFYSQNIYPPLSAFLSILSSPFTFTFQTIAILLIILLSVLSVVKGVRNRVGWKKILARQIEILLFTYVWFYMSWCLNYSRSTIYERTSTSMVEYNEQKFKAFAIAFIENANNSWTSDTTFDRTSLEHDVKNFYDRQSHIYGLSKSRTWQHAKMMDLPSFYSSVSVTGFMAPLFSESLLNPNLLSFDYPFTYAHELSHLLGVSSEAEANWWAYHACVSSTIPSVRYSGYKGILPYLLSNARRNLNDKEYEELFKRVRPEVIADLLETQKKWKALRSPFLDEIQGWIYDAFLKSNNVNSGLGNYSEVVEMLIAIDLI